MYINQAFMDSCSPIELQFMRTCIDKLIYDKVTTETTNVVYLLGGNPETQKEMSERIGNKLQWNKEKSNYEIVPVVTKERLSRMSVGEAVVTSQRKNPYITRYLPFDRYIFYGSLGKAEEPPVQQLIELHPFSLQEAYEQLSEINEVLENKQKAIEEKAKEQKAEVPDPQDAGKEVTKNQKVQKKSSQAKHRFDDIDKYG